MAIVQVCADFQLPPDGNHRIDVVMYQFHDGREYFLIEPNEGPIGLFHDRDQKGTTWTIEGNGARFSIKNRDSGHYISYGLVAPPAPVESSISPSYFVSEEFDSGIRILTADRIDGKQHALERYPLKKAMQFGAQVVTGFWASFDIKIL
ncbi:hypothetical protein BGW42_000622 [Actinomortierella wolfii]|nr:hypothetical protein BGW42_000622 [Actinomortierella wolfii]